MKLQILVLSIAVGSYKVISDGVGHGHDDYEYSPYHFEYNVHDDKEYLDFGHQEEDDGQGNVHGYYHVQLPDGRHQRVDYHVDGYSGYIADVKYDGEASHPSYQSSGHHGRLGKSLNLDAGLKTQSKFNFKKSDNLQSGNQRSGKSLSFDSLPTYSSSGRQGKSLDFETDLSHSASHLHRSQESEQSTFGQEKQSDRQGKSLPLERKAVDVAQPETNPVIRPLRTFHDSFEHQSSSLFGSFGRKGKSLNSERNQADENRFGSQFKAGQFSSDQGSFGTFGNFGSSLRKGKSLGQSLKTSNTKQKKPSLITRKRIERAGTLEASASERLSTLHTESTSTPKKKPVTFFDFAPKNVKSPFSPKFYKELQLRSSQSKKESKEKPGERNQIQLYHEVEESPLPLNPSSEEGQQNQVLEKDRTGLESEKSSLPVIRGHIIYGP